MKKLFSTLSMLILSLHFLSAQNPEFDSILAKKLGADEIGMKMYVLVILKTGSAQITDTAIRAELFRGHFANINKLAAEGKMLTAGPLEENEQQYRGIFLFNVGDINEAKELLKGDPTVVNHIFEPLFFELYGSAALQEIPGIHRKIQKTVF
ncbi:MAG TPA: YciI family protein [Bacteroidales bacterium]|nr:YciI family protein [Bacteroidales bacterium]